ncbi:fatty acid desaturase [Pseudomonas cucumis]|uniref:Fatty acid desaturase n=1 Tax=Pseudomonas cucumis TaxID=2954082 RepID=A0ABY9F0K7_9PSED|nr:fatty acid desaturase [Pseudomonas cucumis]WLG85671.1 fatty acid desaturase [Pseudomonas cucumis]
MDKRTIVAAALSDFKNNRGKWVALYFSKVFIWGAWIAACVYGILVAQSTSVTVMLQLLLGAAFAHGVELQHQALHQSGFRSRRANRYVGILLGLPMFVSYSSYQDSHLFHHKALGKPEDAEFFEYGDKTERQVLAVIKHFFLINHFCDFLKNVIDALNGRRFMTKLIPQNAQRIRFEYLLMAVAVVVAFFVNSELLFKCWMVPLFLFAAPIHALIELPEHYACNKNSTDVFDNTRSIKTHPLASWFTNGNNYHVEHHWIASLPVEQLASVHQKIELQINHLSSSYFSFYRRFFSSLLFGNRTVQSQQGL